MKATLQKHYRRTVKSIVRRSFPLLQKLGVHVVLNHHYGPVPDTSALPAALWREPSSLPGLSMREAEQLALLQRFAAKFRAEYDALPQQPSADPAQYFLSNTSFSAVDAEIFYCMIREFRPARVFEIGSGHSTRLAAQALRKNAEEGARGELTACEPYPADFLRRGFPGLSRLIEKKVQDVPLMEFEALGANDILFIDSTHVLKTGSDVHYEFLEVLPRLKPGVLVHVHDIFLPEEYPVEWLTRKQRFWTEQYLLQAFLAHNDSFEVLWAGNYMRLKHPEALRAAFRTFAERAVRPGSFWMRRVK